MLAAILSTLVKLGIVLLADLSTKMKHVEYSLAVDSKGAMLKVLEVIDEFTKIATFREHSSND